MMKKLSKASLVTAALMLISWSSLAADHNNLQVSGRISAAYCDVVESSDILYLPTVLTSSLPQTGTLSANTLPSYQSGVYGIYFYIACTGSGNSHISFTLSDTYSADLHPDAPVGRFALKDDNNENVSVGYYTLSINDALINQTDPAGTLQSRTDWLDDYTEFTGGELLADHTRQYSYTNQVTAQATRLEFKLTPNLFFWGTDKLDPTVNRTISGSFTVDVIF